MSEKQQGAPSEPAGGALDEARLRKLLADAIPTPWCAEQCGEKGDGSNMIGVAYHPDDKDCERPLAGWIEPFDGDGNEIDYYRDETVAEVEHRHRASNQTASLIMEGINALPRLLDERRALIDGCNAMVGLIQLVTGRDDMPPAIREALLTSHRLAEARAALAAAQGV